MYFEVVGFSPEVVPWKNGVVLHYFQVSYLSQKWFFSLFSLTKHAINFSDRASEPAFNFWKLDIFFAIRPLLTEIWTKICFEGTWKCWSITWLAWSSTLIKPSIYSENSEVVLQYFQVPSKQIFVHIFVKRGRIAKKKILIFRNWNPVQMLYQKSS